MTPALATALALVDEGRPVFPCKRDKTPLTKNGFRGASMDAGVVRAWWAKHPDAMIGLPTGAGWVVIDTDVDLEADPPVNGEEQLAKLPPLPDTYTVQTPRGGRHRYYLTDEPLPCSSNKIAKGVDIRGDGGYVIAPPSAALAGVYEVTSDAPMQPLPAEWVALIRKPVKEAEGDDLPATMPEEPHKTPATADVPPWEDYAHRTLWAEILVPLGWKQEKTVGENTHWTRPGKDKGTSATTRGEDGPMYVFTGNGRLPAGEGMSKHFVYAQAHHGGDMVKAAKALREAGYGSSGRDVLDVSGHRKLTEAEAEAVSPEKAMDYWTINSLRAYQPRPEDYLIGDGWMRKAATSLMIGGTGIGKSVLATQVAGCLATGTDILETLSVKRAIKVIIIEAENDQDTVKRDLCSITDALGLDAAMLNENLRIYQRPGLNPLMLSVLLRTIYEQFAFECAVIDNYQSFIGAADINSTEAFFEFRAAVEPFMFTTGAAMLLLAHPPKPKTDDKNQRHAREGVYNAAGTSALANWVRTSCELALVTGEDGRCALKFAKNAERLGLHDGKGGILRHIYVERSESWKPYWRLAASQDKPMSAKERECASLIAANPEATSSEIGRLMGYGGVDPGAQVRKRKAWQEKEAILGIQKVLGEANK